MSHLIVPNEISGGSVYGVKQYEYTVGGTPGQDYSAALTVASFKQAVAIEDAASSYADVVRERERKIEDLGVVLAALAEGIATMDPKSQDTNKKSSLTAGLYNAKQICDLYNITMNLSEIRTEGGVTKASISYRNATNTQEEAQYAMDVEDNNLQQDMVALQSLISKRDNAFSTAAKVVKKADGTASKILRNFT